VNSQLGNPTQPQQKPSEAATKSKPGDARAFETNHSGRPQMKRQSGAELIGKVLHICGYRIP
jgi:hypothetical protein